jgi:hypothetical protein
MEDRSLEDMERNRKKKRKCPKINQLFKIEISIEITKEDKEMKIKMWPQLIKSPQERWRENPLKLIMQPKNAN